MEEKSIDGIKKLNKEEVEKSRKIILDTIGEGEQTPISPPAQQPALKMDGIIKMDKIKSLISNSVKETSAEKPIEQPTKIDIEPKGPEPKIDFLADVKEEEKKVEVKPQKPVKTPKAVNKVKIIEPRTNKVDPFRFDEIKPIPRTTIDKNKAQDLKAEIEKREKDIKTKEQERFEKEKAQKDQKEMEIKRQKEEKRKKEELKRIKKEEKKKQWSSFSTSIKRSLVNFGFLLRSMPLKVLQLFFISFVFLTFFYSIIALSIIKLHLDNRFLRFTASYLPVPALLTNDEIIDFYSYQKIKEYSSSLNKNVDPDTSAKLFAIQLIILNKLNSKYNTGFVLRDIENIDAFKSMIADKAIYDEDINQVSLNRIRKIKQNIFSNRDDFNQIGSKYGDKTGELTINRISPEYDYYSKVQNLNPGEVSDIIYTREGYYIFRCYNKTADQNLYGYVFVQAKTLDDYIQQEAKDLKIISLVN